MIQNNFNTPEKKKDELEGIPEDITKLSVMEALGRKHVVFEIGECFEKTKVNLFDDFISLYTKSYDASPEEQAEIKQELEANIYAVRFDPALFLLRGTATAGYIPELKTLLFPDLKSYKNPEIYVHEATHAIGSICVDAGGKRIEDHEIYVGLNEGITEKMPVEMVGKKDEAYSPNVKCAQIIDSITDGWANKAFRKRNVGQLQEAYDGEVYDGAFMELVFGIHGVENILKEIDGYEDVVLNFEKQNDLNSLEFIEKYDAIRQIIDEEEALRLRSLEDPAQENKEKYLAQVDKGDEELKKFKDEVITYVIAKEYLLECDHGGNIDLICEGLVTSLEKHLGALVDKSNTQEEQLQTMQKLCNIQSAFDFSENKIPILENLLEIKAVDLHKKMGNGAPTESASIYEASGVRHNLIWLHNTTGE